MNGARVLIVEDEPKIARLLQDYLLKAGHTALILHDGSQAVSTIRAGSFDLLVLDLMLPGKDGLSICCEVRSFSTLPIIMTTARVEEIDKLLGLKSGADDYVCKPYSPREVVARVNAQLRRAGWRSGTAIEPPEPLLAIDDASLRANIDGKPLALTPTEFRLLRALATQPGRVLSRDQILDHVHDDGRAITDRAVDSHVRNLRRKIVAVTGALDPIRSVYGVGYAFEWPQA